MDNVPFRKARVFEHRFETHEALQSCPMLVGPPIGPEVFLGLCHFSSMEKGFRVLSPCPYRAPRPLVLGVHVIFAIDAMDMVRACRHRPVVDAEPRVGHQRSGSSQGRELLARDGQSCWQLAEGALDLLTVADGIAQSCQQCIGGFVVIVRVLFQVLPP